MDAIADSASNKSRLKAEEYRARARDAFAAAETTPLERVRHQRLAAAASWTELADAEEARLATRLTRLAESAK